jgi:hypothetical protein
VRYGEQVYVNGQIVVTPQNLQRQPPSRGRIPNRPRALIPSPASLLPPAPAAPRHKTAAHTGGRSRPAEPDHAVGLGR